MKDNLKSKISILFVIILMILSTLLACNALAEELTQTIYGKMDIRSEHTYTLPEGSYIPYEDLDLPIVGINSFRTIAAVVLYDWDIKP